MGKKRNRYPGLGECANTALGSLGREGGMGANREGGARKNGHGQIAGTDQRSTCRVGAPPAGRQMRP